VIVEVMLGGRTIGVTGTGVNSTGVETLQIDVGGTPVSPVIGVQTSGCGGGGT
jgi:hypothetical protein